MTTLATVIGKGAIGSRPAAASAGRLYFSTEPKTYRDNGSSWDDVSDAGTGFANPMTTAGDIIYGGASGVATRLAGGTSAYVLTSNGATSAPSWQAAPGGGSGALVFLEAHTASTSATLDFTTFISSTYDTYLFEFVDVLPATNATFMIAYMGTGGGPTYDTGANYAHTMWRFVAAGSASSGSAGGDTSMWVTDSSDTLSNDATWNGASGFIKLYNPQSVKYKRWVGEMTYRTSGSATEGIVMNGTYQSTTVVTAMRFQMVSGNIASGTIRAYGVTKS